MKERVDYLEGRVRRIAAPVAKAMQQVNDTVDVGGVFLELVELALRVDDPRR
jgi:hypothetical protein